MDCNSKEFREFYKIILEMDNNPSIQEMKKYKQHYDCSCYEHCLSASYYCYRICKTLHLDAKSAARAAFVHDLFLYDWRVRQPGRKGLHAFTHPRTAYEKASNLFSFNKKEKDIILKHMWPVTPIPPRYLESFILTLVDKYCAVKESFCYYSNALYSKKIYRFATFVLPLFFIHLP
jgi:uncharacterized protein